MKIFIPIKERSQRVPRKNFRSFNGVPLYKHTLYKLKDLEVYVDTDSDEILRQVREDKELSHVTAYKRADYLVGHRTSVCELIKYFIQKNDLRNKNICQIHVTSPFLELNTLTSAYKTLEGGYDSVVSCTTVQTRLWRKEDYGMCPVNHNPMKLEQTQELPVYYEENSLFYIFNSDILISTGNRVGRNPNFYATSFPENLDIDTEDDWDLIKNIYRSTK